MRERTAVSLEDWSESGGGGGGDVKAVMFVEGLEKFIVSEGGVTVRVSGCNSGPDGGGEIVGGEEVMIHPGMGSITSCRTSPG